MRDTMSNGFNRGNDSNTDITNEMSGVSRSSSIYKVNKTDNKKSKHSIDLYGNNAPFSGSSNEFQSFDGTRSKNGVENLSFQEWTEKYHQ